MEHTGRHSSCIFGHIYAIVKSDCSIFITLIVNILGAPVFKPFLVLESQAYNKS